MSKTQEALKLALEALELHGKQYPHMVKGYCLDAITAIREALAEQPAQQQKEGFASPGGGYVPAIPRPMPLDWKLVPRKATPEMLKAMDECAQEGYDERLYAGMASSVYMAAWDASPVMGTLPEQPAQQQEPVAWMPIEQMYPQAKAIDILMGDGSILCAVLPQFDGDLWWDGSGTGEKFIDPKYANVTHWRIHDERTSPPASKPLTDEQIFELASGHQDWDRNLIRVRSFARAIEAAHGIKE